jgi:hypothetical protein
MPARAARRCRHRVAGDSQKAAGQGRLRPRRGSPAQGGSSIYPAPREAAARLAHRAHPACLAPHPVRHPDASAVCLPVPVRFRAAAVQIAQAISESEPSHTVRLRQRHLLVALHLLPHLAGQDHDTDARLGRYPEHECLPPLGLLHARGHPHGAARGVQLLMMYEAGLDAGHAGLTEEVTAAGGRRLAELGPASGRRTINGRQHMTAFPLQALAGSIPAASAVVAQNRAPAARPKAPLASKALVTSGPWPGYHNAGRSIRPATSACSRCGGTHREPCQA